MAEFEIREIRGKRRVAKFATTGVDPGDEIACVLLLRKEIRDRKLRSNSDAYYLRAYHPRKGWKEYRAP